MRLVLVFAALQGKHMIHIDLPMLVNTLTKTAWPRKSSLTTFLSPELVQGQAIERLKTLNLGWGTKYSTLSAPSAVASTSNCRSGPCTARENINYAVIGHVMHVLQSDSCS